MLFLRHYNEVEKWARELLRAATTTKERLEKDNIREIPKDNFVRPNLYFSSFLHNILFHTVFNALIRSFIFSLHNRFWTYIYAGNVGNLLKHKFVLRLSINKPSSVVHEISRSLFANTR